MRGRFVLGFGFVVLALLLILDGCGAVRYALDPSIGSEPVDGSFAERASLIAEWMIPACVVAWVTCEFRARNEVLFGDGGLRTLPYLLGAAGLLVQAYNVIRWIGKAYSGVAFGGWDGLPFGAGWLLLLLSVVFWPSQRTASN